tara:strand:+ start:87 stop:383 length:297 start_codon:yes stop_codon:yes gene_type:complete
MNKKYVFSTEAEAEEMILSLVTANEDGETPNFRDVKGTETTKGIVCLGFQDSIEIDEETEEEIVIEGTTYDVDVAWKTVNESWDTYEVFPITSNHNFL